MNYQPSPQHRVTSRCWIEIDHSPRIPAAFPLSLTWSTDDPWAVYLSLHRIGQEAASVTWVSARSLLHTGLHRDSGVGDVRVGPVAHEQIGVRLGATRPNAITLLIDRWDLQRFLDDTYELVPLGHEQRPDRFDTDLDALTSSA